MMTTSFYNVTKILLPMSLISQGQDKPMRFIPFAVTLLSFTGSSIFSVAKAQIAPDPTKANLSAITDDRRQAALAHLARQDLAATDDDMGVDINQTNINQPNWQDDKNGDSCFLVDEIDFVIEGGEDKHILGMTPSNLRSFLLSPLLDWTKPTYALNHCINNHNLSLIVDIAHNELLKRGYLTSSISIEEQDLSTKKLTLTVHAGKVKKVILADASRTPTYVKAAIPLKFNQAFRLSYLEQGLDNLKRIDPTATAQIIPSSSSNVANDIDINTTNLGFSDLLIRMDRSQSAVFGINIDNSLSKDYGNYLISANVRANNLMHLNDEWNLSANYPLARLIDAAQNDLGVQVGKDRQVNYHASLTIPYGLYKFSATHSHHQYQQFLEGLHAPLTYHGTSKTSSIGLSRLLHRDGNQKTEGYIKVNHKRSSNYIDDVNLEVQNRRTTGYNIGITHQHHLHQGGYLYANLDYQQGTGALKAKPAPEEHIYDAFGRQLPSEGFAKAPIWSLYTSFQKPFVLNNPNDTEQAQDKATANKPIYTSIPLTYTARLQAQYAKQLPVPSDLFYLGGRYSIKGIKEGNYLSGEHGFSLSQELAWQLPLQKLNQHFSTNANSAQLYASIDQGYAYGKNTLNNQRHILAGAVGMRYYFQGSQDPRIQETQNGLTHFKESNTYLNNTPTTAHLDIFIGKGIKTPEFMKKETVVGVSASIEF